MAAVPQAMHATIPAIFALHEKREGSREARPYLGCSELGETCSRRLWLRFRWAAVESFEGRMLRLFDTGNREEARLIEELIALGVTVTGRQHEVVFCDGHARGHLDAAVQGLLEAPATWHVFDAKTAKASKFAEVQKHGMAKVYPKYVAQAQLYMGLAGMTRAAFFFVNKDTDELHLERVEFDQKEFERLLQKAKMIVYAPQAPERISSDPSWYECKFCPFHALCHGQEAPAANCRTCVHATPREDGDGRWTCDKHNADLPTQWQRAGCQDHLHFPDLVASFAEIIDSDDATATYRNKLTGVTFQNGPDHPAYSSKEIHAARDKRLLGEAGSQEIRNMFEGRIIA